MVAYIRLPFNTIGAPTINKRWHKVTIEVDAAPTAALFMIAEYDYCSFDLPAGVTNAFTVQAGGGFWNEANWDSFYWSAQVVGQAYAYLDGIGTNMSLVIRSEATYEDAHTLAALTINFSPRGLKR